jgi:cell division protein FtsQ
MWDDPQALRRLANSLMGLAVLLVMVIALNYALHLPVFALRAVQLDTRPQRVERAQLEAAARRSLRGNFFTVDLDQARDAFEQLPWVRSVSVRRQFPWQLDVRLEEREALARWNGNALVDTDGEVFVAKDSDALPDFSGPDDAAAEMAQRYAEFGRVLAPLGFRIAAVDLSPRHAWRLTLQNGMIIELGRDDLKARLARFVAAYPQYAAQMKAPAKYVDLRYRDGFAAGMRG